jgi:uncharacterized protein with HEPN domain
VVIRHPEIPWQDMSDFRNILVHEYFRVDTEIVWNVITKELPDLKNKVRSMSE